MFVLIVGCGRVGSGLARSMLAQGHTVSCLDRDPESHARLELESELTWEESGGSFTVGAALETRALEAAGIERADVFVAATNGDNTNIVISQIAERRYRVTNVIARILDPWRAKWYRERGLEIVSPTGIAIEMLEKRLNRAAKAGPSDPAREGGDGPCT